MLAMTLVSLISYVDRNTLALLSPAILAETGLSAEQYGYIISAFSVAYMIGNPVWGSLLDRFGMRRGMLSAVSFWTLASAAHAFAGGLWSFGALAQCSVLGGGDIPRRLAGRCSDFARKLAIARNCGRLQRWFAWRDHYASADYADCCSVRMARSFLVYGAGWAGLARSLGDCRFAHSGSYSRIEPP